MSVHFTSNENPNENWNQNKVEIILNEKKFTKKKFITRAFEEDPNFEKQILFRFNHLNGVISTLDHLIVTDYYFNFQKHSSVCRGIRKESFSLKSCPWFLWCLFALTLPICPDASIWYRNMITVIPQNIAYKKIHDFKYTTNKM